MKSIVVAYDNNRVIGGEGKLPWQGEMPADMRHFRSITIGHTVIMGRKTFESIGRPLPERQNIIVSRMANFAVSGAMTARSLEEAYDLAEQDAYVIGGGQLYEAALPTVDKIYATEIDTISHGDTFFSAINPAEWTEIDRIEYPADDKNKFDYSFVTYKRN